MSDHVSFRRWREPHAARHGRGQYGKKLPTMDDYHPPSDWLGQWQLEQVTGLEPASPAWKASILTIGRHLQVFYYILDEITAARVLYPNRR